jgi:hypothetical protein
MNDRRSFIGSAVAAMLGMLGLGSARANSPKLREGDDRPVYLDSDPAGQAWVRGQIDAMGQSRFWTVHYADANCGAGTCGVGANSDGFRAILSTPKHTYAVVVRPVSKERPRGYLGAILTGPNGGSDLADGKLIVRTWNRIYADIIRVEKTGSKYA